jgi:hypothetical protein
MQLEIYEQNEEVVNEKKARPSSLADPLSAGQAASALDGASQAAENNPASSNIQLKSKDADRDNDKTNTHTCCG